MRISDWSSECALPISRSSAPTSRADMTITEPAPPVTTRPDVDLLDPEFHVGDPHPSYTWMRANEPIYRDRNGIWCMTRMEHVRHDERHASDFVRSRGSRSTWFPRSEEHTPELQSLTRIT